MSAEPTGPKCPEPGLHPGMSFQEYHAIPAVSHSRLEPFKRTPAHAREAILHPKEPTAELALGHAFHVFLLEEPLFHSQYVVPPKVDRRFKVGKEEWARFELENPGKACLSADEVEQYERMRDSIMGHPVAADLISKAVAKELSFVWTEPVELESGTKDYLCKGREDIISPYGGYVFIVNLKTTKDASERSFSRDIANYGYHRGSAWYRRGLAAATKPAERRVAYIAVEKEPPYCVAVHELDERALQQGEREMLGFLQQYASCAESGIYPGYDPGLSLLDLPPWAVDRID